MEEHQLERSVTEQYLLCLLDKAQIDFTDSVGTVIEHRIEIVRKLVANGLSKQSDLNLLMIEQELMPNCIPPPVRITIPI